MSKGYTTSISWCKQAQTIRDRFDKVLASNPLNILPALTRGEYETYLKAVTKANPLHRGEIFYRGQEVKKV